MKGRAKAEMMLTLFLASMLCVVFNMLFVTADPNIIRVPEDYERIQWAVGNASAGDTILVAAGTYYEHVTIDKSLTLIGEDPSTTIINGNGTGTVVTITTNRVCISNFTIQNSGGEYPQCGIISTSSFCNITYNNIANNRYGIYLESSSNNSIVRNSITTDDEMGIVLHESSNNSIVGNSIMVRRGTGIRFYGSSNNIIAGNNITNNACGIEHSGSSNSIVGNNITNNGQGIWIYGFSNNSIVGNYIANNGDGIRLFFEDSNNNVIVENNIVNNRDKAIILSGASNNSIVKNNMANNEYGILLHAYPAPTGASYNHIIGNNITANNKHGIWLVESSNYNSIVVNNIMANKYGINLWSSSNNTIVGNNIAENDYGIAHSSNNSIYHNNFLENIQQVLTSDSVNVWDDGYPSGGNFWSDYAGVDLNSGPYQNETGSDGVGDIPYVIDNNNQDNYPLIHPYGSIRNLDTNLTYLTIQSAIDAPETLNGHTIKVDTGLYYEHVTVYKSLTLVGEDPNTTIIDGNGTETVVYINADNVNISGFTVQNSGWWYLGDSGIHLYRSNENIISNNIVVSNNGYGIWLDYSGGNTLRDNNMNGNKYNFGVSGFSLSHFIQDIDTSNVVNGKPIYYLIDQRNILVDSSSFPDVGYLGLINSINVTVRDLNVMNNFQGVLLAYTTGSTIENLNASNNYCGISLEYSRNCTASRNKEHDNYCGILLEWCNDNVIIGNNVSNNEEGIWLRWSYSNRIIDNAVTSNDYSGVRLEPASDNNAVGNNAISNNDKGVALFSDSSGNRLIGNTVSNNKRGIFMWHSGINNTIINNTISNNDYGIELYKSSNNTIYYNNFDNPHQVYPYFLEESVNNWDNGAEGNYWSDYTGGDADGDGIGDTSYVIDANNTDNYPLMGTFSDFSVIWEEETYHVTTICNSTISNFDFGTIYEEVISFNVTGAEGTVGFCRVCIPHALFDGNYTVLVDGQPPLTSRTLPASNSTHTFLYFTYIHTTHQVVIIPEFPAAIVLSLLMILTLIAVILAKGKALQRNRRISDAIKMASWIILLIFQFAS